MAAETAKSFEALERQAQALMQAFIKAGHEAVAPAIIQPAGIYLDAIGETIRARTYVFTDAAGDELCLRPDLTVPTCRLHLERNGAAPAQAKYCYNGPIFRYQPAGVDRVHPREFRQAGIETFSSGDAEVGEVETLSLVLRALAEAGLHDQRLRLGDLGLFRALLDAIPMPTRWRHRLLHRFWRPAAFRAELRRLATDPALMAPNVPKTLLKSLDPARPGDAEQAVVDYLEGAGIELIGTRSAADIAESLLGLAADLKAEPLAARTVSLIERYLRISGPASGADAKIRALVAEHELSVGAALDRFDRRLALFANAGIDLERTEFSAEFGRNLEYYTGFVFEIWTPRLGQTSPVAGGGRYDELMRTVGSSFDLPAVGAAIHTERLLAAVEGGAA